jgi:membrane-associated phospholipid phosphatase
VSLSCVVQLIAFTASAAPLSYLVASINRPLWDQTLYAWDQSLGLDWRTYLGFVNARPWLGLVYSLAYESILPQMIVAVVVLGLAGKLMDCRQFVAAVLLAALISIVISAAAPAMVVFVHLGLQAQDYENLSPAAPFIHVAHLTAIRDATLRVISLDDMQGIIAFPSYHAALGVIFAVSFWNVRWLRWPGLAINAAMIAATPIDGGHYFVDVLAGIIVAIVSLTAVRAFRLHAVKRMLLFQEVGTPVKA